MTVKGIFFIFTLEFIYFVKLINFNPKKTYASFLGENDIKKRRGKLLNVCMYTLIKLSTNL